MVDDKGPECVIVPPYDKGGCRTRREVDPWWEVDLGRTQSVHSVSFTATGALQQKMHIFVILLRGPVGFENPFLDETLKVSCGWQEFVFEESSNVLEESRSWDLPDKMFGGAVRIQIRGKHVLRLSRCQVFQGDDLPPADVFVDFSKPSRGIEADPISLDDMMRITSFASHPLSIFDDLKKENPRSQNVAAPALEGKEKQIQTIKRVNVLNVQYQARKARVDWWLDRARDSANFFTIDELMCLRDVLFVPVSSSSKYSSGKRMNKSVIPTHDLRGNSLTQHYPRCEFKDLIKQIKQVSEWIQNRQHTRDISAFLVAPEKFGPLFRADDDLFERLGKVLIFLEETWDGSGRRWGGTKPQTPSAEMMIPVKGKRATLLGQLRGNMKGGASDPAVEPQVVDGASWSQVVMTMHLLCLNDVENIPEYVFAVDEGLEMLFPLDHDDSDADDSEGISEDNESKSMATSTRSDRQKLRRTRSKVKSVGSPIVRRALSPPPPDAIIGKNGILETRSEHRPCSAIASPPCGRSSILASFDPFKQPQSTFSGTSNNLSNTTPLLLNSVSSPPTSSGGGRRLASTMPLEMSQLFQLSLLNVQEQPKTFCAIDNLSLSDVLNNKVKKKRTSETGAAKNDSPSLLELTKDPRMPRLNFEHAQYKLQRLQKSAKLDRIFPKTLQKDFPVESPLARYRLESREKHKPCTNGAQTSSVVPFQETNSDGLAQNGALLGETNLLCKGQGSMSWDGDLFGTSFIMSGENSPNHSFDERDMDRSDSFLDSSRAQSAMRDKKTKNARVLKYTRSCMLCTQSFPKKSVENKIMMKHIITVRKALDPVLGSKFAAHLMQGLSPYNLVYICEFCFQFFDPDMPEGVCMPELQRYNNIEEPDSLNKKVGKGMDTYFDERYPGSMRTVGNISSAEDLMRYREQMSLTRARAKNAIEVARYISESGTAEEERRMLREQMEAQIKAGFGGVSLRRSSMITSPMKKI